MLNARLYGFWGWLTEALRTGEPQNEARDGGDVFGTLYTDPSRLEAAAGMTAPLDRGFGQANSDSLLKVGSVVLRLQIALLRRAAHA